MKCSRCGKNIVKTEPYTYHGRSLCEDCYMDALNPPKGCDPWAVHSAQTFLKGKDKSATLTEIQQEIIRFVREQGKATAEEIAAEVGLSQEQLLREFATLRHMELLRRQRSENGVYYALFEKN